MKLGSKKLWWTVFLVLITLVIITFFVLSLPIFGGEISGERLERVQANPQYQDGSFTNVGSQFPFSFFEVGSFFTESLFYDEIRIPPTEIPIVSVAASSLSILKPSTLRAFWIGHASVYVEIDGIRMLIDPVFSNFASPFDFGPKRFHPPPITLQDLPKIDAVVISHDHYDHLDMKTIIHLSERGTLFFVPLGIGAHLEKWEVPKNQIRELEWWQGQMVGKIKIICTPTRHYSGRGLTDYKATLWSSWSVIGPEHRFYYSGDTGYSKHFKEIGERFGPFDMSFIKIGAYGPGDSWLDIHMDPKHAVQAHIEVRAKRMFPVHWGTFNLAYHAWDEPIKLAQKAASKAQIDLVTPRIGEFVFSKKAFHSRNWWEQIK
jgi:L-ascorbate metabolism protein UlaG (beta-lactamase superfamily)